MQTQLAARGENHWNLDRPGRPRYCLLLYAVMLADSRHDAKLSALSLRSVLDGVAARLDEGREVLTLHDWTSRFLGLAWHILGAC